MPILNLQKLLDSDNITQIVSKINENFNQLSINGGGPQGKPGYQGPPGLPGLTGRIGVAGDKGEDGSKIIFTESDGNWGVKYGYPLDPSTANIAVEIYGYNVGDTWIDNSNGYFYDIIEDTIPGNYLFQPHQISPAVLSSGDLWEADTSSNLTNDVEQGVRNRNRYSTLSLTSIPKNIGGETANYDLIASDYSPQNASVLGYARKAFKLSIDNVSGDNTILRVSGGFGGFGDIGTQYGKKSNDLVPLMYFSNADDFDFETTSFGLFISSYAENNNKISILTLASSANESTLDQLFIKTAKTGTSKELYFQNNETGPHGDAYISLLNVDNNGDQKTDPNSLWLGISTIASADLPFPGNEHTNLFGIETRYYNDNGVTIGGKINFYVNDNGTASGKHFVMSLTEKGGLALGTNTPSSSYSSDDNTNNHRFIVKSLGSDVAKLKNIVAIMPNQSSGVASVGEKLVFGFLDSETAIIRSIVSTDTNEGVDTYQKLVLQPNGTIDSTNNINAVGIGQEEPTAKLHIGGNLKIDEVKGSDNGNILTYNEDKEVCKAVPSDLGLVEGSGTATQVAFWDGTLDQPTNKLSGNAKLYWDNENNILGIGFKAGSTPLSRGDTLTVKGDDDTDTVVSVLQSNSNNNRDVKLNFTNKDHTTLASIGLTSSYDYNPGGDIPNLVGFTDNRLKIYGANNIELATRNTNNFGGGGNIFIRPANMGVPIPGLHPVEGVIILERRVQMIDPAVETSVGDAVLNPVVFKREVSVVFEKAVYTHHIWTGISGNLSFLNDWEERVNIIHRSKSYDRIIKFTTKDLIFFIVDEAQNTAQNPPPIFIPYIIYTRKNGLTGEEVPYDPDDPNNPEWNIHEKGLYSFNGGVVNTIIPAGYEYVIAFRARNNEVGLENATDNIGISGQFIVYEHKFGKDPENVVIPRSNPIIHDNI